MYVWYVDETNTGELDRGIFKTTNGGQTWIQLNINGIVNCGDNIAPDLGGCDTGEQGFFDLELAALPNGNNTDLYAGAVNLFKCTISPANPICSVAGSWKNLTHVYGCSSTGEYAAIAHVHPDEHAIDFLRSNPNIVYFGNDGGIYRSLTASTGIVTGSCTGTNQFQNLNASMGSLGEFVDLTVDPSSPQRMLGGTQDNGSLSNANTSGLQWNAINAGDGGYNAIDPTNPNTWFTANTDVSIQRCTSGASCNTQSFLEIIGSDQVNGDHGDFYMPYLLDPADPSKIILGTCRVWRGNSDGSNWPSSNTANALSYQSFLGPTEPCDGFAPGTISALAAGGSVTDHGSQVIYAGREDGQMAYTLNADGGPSTWPSLQPQPQNHGRISDIFIDSLDRSGYTAYISNQGFTQGYNLPNPGHIYKTILRPSYYGSFSDGFNSKGLPNVPVNTVMQDPVDPNVLYAGTDVGVYATMDNGTTWVPYGTGLPNTVVMKLKTVSAGAVQKLRAATYGRGVWQTDLAQPADYILELDQNDVYGPLPNQFTGKLVALNGYSGSVTVSCGPADQFDANLPSCSPQTLVPTTTGQTFTIPVTSLQGDLSFFVIGRDSNGLTRQVPATFHLRDFGINGSGPLSALSGTSSASGQIEIYPIGPVSDSVQLSCLNYQPGLNCYIASSVLSLAPNQYPTTGISFSFPSSTPDGQYPFTIQANAPLLGATHTYNSALWISGFDMSINPPLRRVVLPGQTATFSGTLDVDLANISSIAVSCEQPSAVLSACTGGTYLFNLATGQTHAAISTVAQGNSVGAYLFSIRADAPCIGCSPYTDIVTRRQPMELDVVDLAVTAPAPSSIQIATNSQATAPLNVIPLGLFNGSVTLDCDPATLPTGVSCSFSQPTVQVSAPTTEFLTVLTTNTATPGTYALIIRASTTVNSTQVLRTATLTLSINAAQGSSDLAVNSVTGPGTVVAAGQAATFSVIVSNIGTDASGVSLTLIFENAAAVTRAPNNCIAVQNTATCNLGTLVNGSALPLSFEVLAPFTRQIVAWASVWSAFFSDPQPANNSASGTAEVRPRPFARFGLPALTP